MGMILRRPSVKFSNINEIEADNCAYMPVLVEQKPTDALTRAQTRVMIIAKNNIYVKPREGISPSLLLGCSRRFILKSKTSLIKIAVTVIAIIISVLLTSCDLLAQICEHKDADCNGLCDVCALELDSCHSDSDEDGACDRCGDCITHTDVDKDGDCDHCDECLTHVDLNCDGKCDKCATPIELSHTDANSDGLCDKCEVCLGHIEGNDGKCKNCGICLSHRDNNCDGYCDNCRKVTPYEHPDADENGICDRCGKCLVHLDENCDGKCDRCDASTVFSHKDENDDGKCDKCGNCIDHRDEDCSGRCDNCDASVDLGHTDKNSDGACDRCEACISHLDNNCNGECDRCSAAIEIIHRDNDNDTLCDGCGAPTKPVNLTIKKSVSVSEGKTVYPATHVAYNNTVLRGAYITYTITVANVGEGAARVDVSDTVPYGTAYVSGAETVDGVNLGWHISLGIGEEKSVSYTVSVTLGEDSVGETIRGTSATAESVSAGCHDIYVTNRLNEIDEKYISLGIRILSVSTYTGFDFAKHAYTIAFTNANAVAKHLNGTASDVLGRLFAGDTNIAAMTAPGLYGGLLLTSPINGALGIANSSVSAYDLIAGDIILAEKNGIGLILIYDGTKLYDVTEGATVSDLERLLSEIPSLDRYAVLRPSMTMTSFTPSNPDETPEELGAYQEAILATASTYLLRGESLQYEDVYFGLISQSGEHRWAVGEKAPEEYTTDEWGYVNCAVFTYDVYKNALGYALPSKMYTTSNLSSNSASNGMRVFRFENKTPGEYTEEYMLEIQRQFMEIAEVGDIINVRRSDSSGHAMLYVGNGRFIHSGGSSYSKTSSGTGYEIYEPTIRNHKVSDYIFNPSSVGGCPFRGSDEYGDRYVTELILVRPLNKFEGDIPENTLARIENMQGIRAEKLSSHPSSITVNPAETITFTFSLYNTTNADRIISISDIVPAGTTYVSGGDTVNGSLISWSVTVPADSTVNVSYTVKVNEDAENGTLIDGRDAKIGGVSYRCAAIRVKRTLRSSERNEIRAAIDTLRREGTTLKGLALVNEIYRLALGIEDIFTDTNADNVMRDGEESVFEKSSKTHSGKILSQIRSEPTYYSSMLVDHLYGGMRFYSANNQHDRTRLLREHNLIVGDVLIGRTSSAVNIYIYAGEGELLLLNSGIQDAPDFVTLRERIMYYGRDFAVLRPSQIIE